MPFTSFLAFGLAGIVAFAGCWFMTGFVVAELFADKSPELGRFLGDGTGLLIIGVFLLLVALGLYIGATNQWIDDRIRQHEERERSRKRLDEEREKSRPEREKNQRRLKEEREKIITWISHDHEDD